MNCFDCNIPCEHSNPLGYCYKEKSHQPSGIKKTNPLFEKCLANVPPEMLERVKKEASCKWFRSGDCGKGLPGTPCSLVGCVAWSEMTEDDEIQIRREYQLATAALALVDAVERYVTPKKGQFCHRTELLNKVRKLKELLGHLQNSVYKLI